MKTYKHNILWAILLCTTIVFGQKQEKKFSESFNVNKDATVEITSRNTDVTIETWNKNEVSVEGVWVIEGVSKEDAEKYFKDLDFEALGNSNKVKIISKSDHQHDFPHALFDNHDFDFNFDFDSISYIGNLFDGNFHFEMPPIPSTPILPEPFIAHLSKIEFDYEEYEKDKEKYMAEFEKRQEEWQKEFEEKIEPQMKKFEENMKKWEEENEPKMKKWQEENKKKMKEWEKENEVKLKELEKRAEKMEKEVEEKYTALLEKKGLHDLENVKIKKTLLIKIPKEAKVKLDARHGTFSFPDDMNTID